MTSELDFSICVATHNRGHLLPRLFNSVARQRGASFELVVVDDGSSDDTGKKLETLARSAAFPVETVSVPNSGRLQAINRALDRATGKFILIMDDDDQLATSALADVLEVWNSIPETDKRAFCGVCGLCEKTTGEIIGHRFPAEQQDDNFFSMRVVRGVRGDKREVVLRSAVGAFRFPKFGSEKYTPTNLLWFHLASRYKTRFVNRTFLIKDYRDDGLTAMGTSKRLRNPVSTANYYRTTLNLFPEAPWKTRIRILYSYLRFARHSDESLTACISQSGMPVWACALLPIIVVANKWERRRSL